MQEVTEQEFNDFISANNFSVLSVVSGSVLLRVYYSSESYNPNEREAYRSVNLENNRFYINGSS